MLPPAVAARAGASIDASAVGGPGTGLDWSLRQCRLPDQRQDADKDAAGHKPRLGTQSIGKRIERNKSEEEKKELVVGCWLVDRCCRTCLGLWLALTLSLLSGKQQQQLEQQPEVQ